MNPLQSTKFVSMIPPGVQKDDAAYTVNVVDTVGWDYLTVACYFGVTDVTMAVLTLAECDTDSGTNVNVEAFNFGNTSGTDAFGNAMALPGATVDNYFAIMHVDLRKRKRYLQLAATAGNGSAGTYMSALGVLSRGEISPDTLAEFGQSTVGKVVKG